MKKSILFLFALFPILASCNNNERGFVDPFPEDEYTPTGFKFGENETVKRALSSAEDELLVKTKNRLEEINAKVICRDEGEIHERDYTRAFAGVFKEGYDISNMKHDEEFVSFYQEQEDKETNEVKLYARKVTTSNVETTFDYSYGQNVSKSEYETITFLGKKESESSNTYIETEIPDEPTEGSGPEAAISAKYEIIAGKKDLENPISAKLESTESETDLLSHLYVKQLVELASPSDGVNSKNEVVLIKENRDPYVYEMSDGRKYSAVKNSLTVTRLSKQTTTKNEEDDPIGDYYLVEEARTYTETAITSKVIQPNVPIEFLNKSIVINYREEFHHFKYENYDKSTDETLTVEVTE